MSFYIIRFFDIGDNCYIKSSIVAIYWCLLIFYLSGLSFSVVYLFKLDFFCLFEFATGGCCLRIPVHISVFLWPKQVYDIFQYIILAFDLMVLREAFWENELLVSIEWQSKFCWLTTLYQMVRQMLIWRQMTTSLCLVSSSWLFLNYSEWHQGQRLMRFRLNHSTN